MSDNVNVLVNGTPTADSVPTPETSAAKYPHKLLYASVEDAQTVKPAGEHKLRIFEVLKDNVSLGFTWAGATYDAICNAARLDGYDAQTAESKRGVVSKELIASRLSTFTDAELKALGLSRRKVKTSPKTDDNAAS